MEGGMALLLFNNHHDVDETRKLLENKMHNVANVIEFMRI
jgi:hypothetical protein